MQHKPENSQLNARSEALEVLNRLRESSTREELLVRWNEETATDVNFPIARLIAYAIRAIEIHSGTGHPYFDDDFVSFDRSMIHVLNRSQESAQRNRDSQISLLHVLHTLIDQLGEISEFNRLYVHLSPLAAECRERLSRGESGPSFELSSLLDQSKRIARRKGLSFVSPLIFTMAFMSCSNFTASLMRTVGVDREVVGEFNRSSQHLRDGGVSLWVSES
ncbi:MAG: hypothetical protein O3B95_08235, partial [Chloroflexi bacterium]|nr:hypothetical protein [Chloroflexota bacterium]